MSLVITATDTEVGKTIVAALVMERYRHLPRLAYWKPIASGAADERDSDTVRDLLAGDAVVLPETFLFEAPLSPHLAARREGRQLDPARVLADYRRHRREIGDSLVIEGIGGLLVPLTDDGALLSDLLVELGLPCVVVARSTLGTINHSLLTLEALRRRDLEIAGVIMNGPPNAENRDAVTRFGKAAVIAEVPPLSPLDRATLRRAAVAFDPQGRLADYL